VSLPDVALAEGVKKLEAGSGEGKAGKVYGAKQLVYRLGSAAQVSNYRFRKTEYVISCKMYTTWVFAGAFFARSTATTCVNQRMCVASAFCVTHRTQML
jgi:hypothetical protein